MQHEIDRRLLLGGAGVLGAGTIGVAATSAFAQEAKPVAPAVKADEKPAGSGRRLSDIIADYRRKRDHATRDDEDRDDQHQAERNAEFMGRGETRSLHRPDCEQKDGQHDSQRR